MTNAELKKENGQLKARIERLEKVVRRLVDEEPTSEIRSALRLPGPGDEWEQIIA